MSFDIDYYREPTGAPDDDGDHYDLNITGNLGGYFAWALHGADPERNKNRSDSRDAIFGKAPADGMKALDGMSGAEARPLLEAAVKKTREAKPEFLEQFNAPNGWGTWPRGLEVLEKMLAWTDEPGEFRVGW